MSGEASGRLLAVGCGGATLALLCVLPPIGAWIALPSADAPPDVALDVPPQAPVPGVSPTVSPTVSPALPPAPPAPGAPPMQPLGPSGASFRFEGPVEMARSVPGVAVGDRCRVTVDRVSAAGGLFHCQARVECGGRTLYGGSSTNGLFDCTVYHSPERHVVGSDVQPSAQDGDPRLELDTLGSTVTVSDDTFGRAEPFELRANVAPAP